MDPFNPVKEFIVENFLFGEVDQLELDISILCRKPENTVQE